MIKLSIITINKNNASGLQKTLDSIYNQTSLNFEYVIIDGGSTDGSIDVIKKYPGKIAYWVSEADKGVYQAMNKGIAAASGEYCYFLNSGDCLYESKSLELVLNEDLRGDILNFDSLVEEDGKRQIVKSKKKISFYDFYIHTILHQATFIKRELFHEIGLYNENLRMVSDWEFFVKALFLKNCSYQSVSITLSIFDAHGYSSMPENRGIGLMERQEVLEKYFEKFLPDYKLLSPPSIYRYLEIVEKVPVFKKLFLLRSKITRRFYKFLNGE